MALTKYPSGSLRELVSIALPLMLSSLSVMLMVFADRWLLAHFSIEAHNAAVTATTMAWAFIFGWIVLANISEVFVAQHNGAGLTNRLGEPVWQMIWLSLSSVAFFWPLAYWGPELFFGAGFDAEMEREYFCTMTFFGPFYPLYATLCGYFVGQGKTRMVTCVVIVANVVNVLLDWFLIFGVEGILEPMGVQGAAIATSAATFFQAFVLGSVFLSQKHRQQFGTGLWRLKWDRLLECVKVGLPSSVFSSLEVFAFAVFYFLMKEMGPTYITIAGICQALFILFYFFAEGLNKATATIVGNLIGARQSDLVSKVIRSGLKLNGLFLILLLTVFVLAKGLIIREFLPGADPMYVESIRTTLELCLFLKTIEIFLAGVRFQFAGVLTASGDTVFLLYSGATLVWAVLILPVYFFVFRNQGSVEQALFIAILYSASGALLYLWRILSGHWKKIVISADLATNQPQRSKTVS